jgi:xanthine dehydrogenase YagS FAD-binding subunit
MNAPFATREQSEFRAAGTDLSERRRTGVSRGVIVDLVPSADTTGISWSADGAARIGASTSIAAVAADAQAIRAYPGLAAAAAGLATPQIRHLATIGGNLAQRSRCWYFRNPHFDCFKKGGSACPSRAGNHLYGVAFDLGPCVAPHPSTLAAALLAYDATVATDKRSGLTIAEVLGDGRSATSDHALGLGEIIKSIQLPPPLAGERAFYKRAISRTYAEWPLVELVVRAVVAGGKFEAVYVAAGGIAPVPLRLTAVERAVKGAAATTATADAAAKQAIVGAKPLPMTGYKLDLLQGLVRDLLGRFAG